MKSGMLALALIAAPLVLAAPSFAQGPNNEARMSAQREAMKALAMLDGEWRGPEKSLRNDGNWHEMVQAERVGTMLDGTVRVLEGRGYERDGKLSFNAFAVISYDPDTKAYTMRSYSGGRAGDFPIVPTPTGFTWEIQAGPEMKIAYEAIVKDGVWTETGTRIPKTGAPVKFIEFSVTRLGDSTWPAAGAVPPRAEKAPILDLYGSPCAQRSDRPASRGLWRLSPPEGPGPRVDRRAGRMGRQWLTRYKSPDFLSVDKRKDSRPGCVDGPLGMWRHYI